MLETNVFDTCRGRVVTVAVNQEDLPVEAVIAIPGVYDEQAHAVGVKLAVVVQAAAHDPLGRLFIRDLDFTAPRYTGDDGIGFFTAQDGRQALRNRVVEADNPELAALIARRTTPPARPA